MTTLIAIDLLDKIILRQIAECMSDRRFARKLGISHQLWQMTRTGKRDVGLVLLKATVKAYPVLNRDVLLFLAGHYHDTIPPQTTRDSLFRRLWRLVVKMDRMA